MASTKKASQRRTSMALRIVLPAVQPGGATVPASRARIRA
jgi:hypothetical protein